MKKQQSNSNIGRKDDAITVLEFVFSNLGQSRINKFWKIMAQKFLLAKIYFFEALQILIGKFFKKDAKTQKVNSMEWTLTKEQLKT